MKAPVRRTSPMALAAGLAALAAASGIAPRARAQQSAFSGEFSVQRFDPAPGPRNFLSTRSVRSDGKMSWSAGLMANWAWQPLVVRSCESETNCSSPNAMNPSDVKVVENLVSGDFLGSLTIVPKLQLGLRLPVTYAKGQGLTGAGRADPKELSAVGLGDALLEGKYRFYGSRESPLAAGGGLFLTAPLGSATAKGKYIGDTLPTMGARAIIDAEFGPLSAGANLVGVFRGKGRVGSTEVGSELRYGVAGAYRVSPVFQVVLDAFGSTSFKSTNGTNALEVDLASRITLLNSPFVFTGGLGTGLVQGVGVPKIRAFLGAIYVLEPHDRDGDGIPDNVDQCPTEPEDIDGFEDTDGCPDRDNDGDTIVDAMDKCPNDAEDFDGYQDTDGCPDLDNDGDGIPDDRDQCPDKPETFNGYKDQDGCPDEPDRDNDGIPDSRDKCPDQAEDTDGFQDEDGCPDPDNDNDGIPDNQDECIDEPETYNGYQDEDGCPDTPPPGWKKEDAKPEPGQPGAGKKPDIELD
jgi:OOP family OmpA-OmpF porin